MNLLDYTILSLKTPVDLLIKIFILKNNHNIYSLLNL